MEKLTPLTAYAEFSAAAQEAHARIWRLQQSATTTRQDIASALACIQSSLIVLAKIDGPKLVRRPGPDAGPPG